MIDPSVERRPQWVRRQNSNGDGPLACEEVDRQMADGGATPEDEEAERRWRALGLLMWNSREDAAGLRLSESWRAGTPLEETEEGTLRTA